MKGRGVEQAGACGRRALLPAARASACSPAYTRRAASRRADGTACGGPHAECERRYGARRQRGPAGVTVGILGSCEKPACFVLRVRACVFCICPLLDTVPRLAPIVDLFSLRLATRQ